MDPIQGSGNCRRGRAVPCGHADYAAQIRRRQAWQRQRARLRKDASIRVALHVVAFLNEPRPGGDRAESSAAAARRAPPAPAHAVPAYLVDYPSSDVDEEMAGLVEAATAAAVDVGPVVVEISDDDDMAVAEEEPQVPEPEEQPQPEPEEQVMARVLARSVRTANREHIRRHHVAAYNAEQLEAGLWASEQFEANRQFWRVDALLQAYMADSSDEE